MLILAVASLAVAGLGWRLGRLDAAALDQQRSAVTRQIDEIDAATRSAAAIGVDQSDLAPIAEGLAGLRLKATTNSSAGLLQVESQAASLNGELLALQRAQQLERAAVEEAGLVIGARYAGRPDALRAAGAGALVGGRNDATVAAFLHIRLGRTAGLMERYAALLASADPDQLALGVAGVQRYSPLVHNSLLAQLPSQVIVVSLNGQHLQALDHGRVVADALVTTGRPELPTDIGRMQVVRKSSPWTMQSPWKKGSPFWYPDTKVGMVLWFTNTGEGIHDAAWEPASAFGPGSTSGPFASHGCVHTPTDVMSVLFSWATVGTPVVVYPGDGSPVTAQSAQVSVDSLGRPLGSQPSGI